MKIKNNYNRGFTLMELVTVISILGILAAMAVPKFFNLSFKAQIETERQISGTITHSKSDSTISWTYTRSTNDVYSIGTRTAI